MRLAFQCNIPAHLHRLLTGPGILCAPPDIRLDPCQYLGDREGLRDVIIRPKT